MSCEFFGPIRLGDSTTIAAWQASCIAARRHPKWTGPWRASGHDDVMMAYCCDFATDVPPNALRATTPGAEPDYSDRQDLLRSDLEALSTRYSILPTVLDSVQHVLAEHQLEVFEGRIEELREIEGANPPDDLSAELTKLKEKLERLGRDPSAYTPKLPWHWQIDIRLLVDILVEIMHILGKLGTRRCVEKRDNGQLDTTNSAP